MEQLDTLNVSNIHLKLNYRINIKLQPVRFTQTIRVIKSNGIIHLILYYSILYNLLHLVKYLVQLNGSE